MIEFPRKRAVSITAVFLGATLVFVGAVALAKAPLAARVFFYVLGGALVLGGGIRAIARTPRFRASEAGVWFGGGATIPWSDVKAVFEASVSTESATTSSIAFEFHRRITLLRTPLEHWVSAPFAVGDIDISPTAHERTTVIAAQIDAMRVRAAGTEERSA